MGLGGHPMITAAWLAARGQGPGQGWTDPGSASSALPGQRSSGTALASPAQTAGRRGAEPRFPREVAGERSRAWWDCGGEAGDWRDRREGPGVGE